MWESRLVSESTTRHPNKTSPLGDSLCLAFRIGKGTPRTCEVYSLYFGWQLPAAGIDPVIDEACTVYTSFSLLTITPMCGGYQVTYVI